MNGFSFAFNLALLCGAVWSGAAADPPAPAPPVLATIELTDQYEVAQRITFPTTKITVLTIADRKGSEQVDGWLAALKPCYSERISLRGLADVGGVPAIFHSRIRKKFRETRTYSVMMDWSGQICAQLKYQPELANLLVISREGAILGRFSGAASGPKVAELSALLDKSLAPTITSEHK